MSWPRVLLPESLEELLELRERHGSDTALLAGGTALMNRIRTGEDTPAALLAMGRLSELRGIEAGAGKLRIGALVTHRQLERSATARAALPLLTSVVSLVANRRVRNVGTLGGNVSDADYGYDPPGVLHALGARVTLRSKHASRELTLDEFLFGHHRTALAGDEVMTGVEVPLPAGDADWVYLKHLTRSAEDRPALSVCALARQDADGRCSDLRISVRAARPVPMRVEAAEAMARGRSLADGELVAEIAEAYARASDPVDDLRASAAYRRRLVPVLVRRALEDLGNRRRRAVKV
ncbi:FAD binding domain-containing protein [Nonomuraea sp. NPDC005650]|uniref:FAD binding domain-containing protein n=1 Tax=Nonomuraea sp. NPDC005650 TaxID=3157045 RepID=UPI0033A929B7